MNTFWVMMKLSIFFGVRHKSGLFWGVISIHFRAFSYSQGTALECFFGGC